MRDPLAEIERNDPLDEKIVKKRNIPAQIVFWVGVLVILYLVYKAITGRP